MRNYKKILKNRNQILKNHEYEILDVLDNQLAIYGLRIQEKRKKVIFQFNQIFGKIFEEITGIEGLKISYDSSWKEKDENGNRSFPTVEIILNHLLERRENDKLMETTMSGPHRDRINFILNNKMFIQTASTGQCRLVALLLRVAQSVYYTKTTGQKPVLLMDDVLLELDPEKRRKLTSLLPDYDQLFCTFLPGEPYEKYMHDTTKIYTIKNGEWYE